MATFPLAVAQAAGVAKTKAPHRTGELARSITFTVSGSLTGSIKANIAHAAPQEFGAGPHEILPVNKLALAGSGFGPVAKVDHPGNPAVHYMEDAAAEFRDIYAAHIGGVL